MKRLFLFYATIAIFSSIQLLAGPISCMLYQKGSKKVLVKGDLHTNLLEGDCTPLDKPALSIMLPWIFDIAKDESKRTAYILESEIERHHTNAIIGVYSQEPQKRTALNTIRYMAAKTMSKLGSIDFICADIRRKYYREMGIFDLLCRKPLNFKLDQKESLLELCQQLLDDETALKALLGKARSNSGTAATFKQLFDNLEAMCSLAGQWLKTEELKLVSSESVTSLYDKDNASEFEECRATIVGMIETLRNNIVKSKKHIEQLFSRYERSPNADSSQETIIDLLAAVIQQADDSAVHDINETIRNIIHSLVCEIGDIGFLMHVADSLEKYDQIVVYVGDAHAKVINKYLEIMNFKSKGGIVAVTKTIDTTRYRLLTPAGLGYYLNLFHPDSGNREACWQDPLFADIQKLLNREDQRLLWLYDTHLKKAVWLAGAVGAGYALYKKTCVGKVLRSLI